MRAEPQASDRGARLLLAAFLAGGLAARLALVFVTGAEQAARFPDSQEYLAIGGSVAAGKGFVLPAHVMGERKLAQRMPGYPLLIAAAYRLSDAPVRAVLLSQSVFGAATLVLVFWMGRLLAGMWAGIIAVALQLLDLYQWYFSALVLTEVATGLALTAAVAAGLKVLKADRFGPVRGRFGGERSVVWAALAGAALAAATYFHPTMVGLALVAGVLALLAKNRKRFLAAWAVGAVVCVTALGPWLVRNWAGLGRPVLTTNLGVSLYDGTQVELGGRSDLAFRERLVPETEGLDELGRDAFYRRRAIQRVAEDPLAWLSLALRKVARTWTPGPNLPEGRTPLRRLAGYISLVPTVILVPVGFWALRRRRGAVAWLLAAPVYVTLLHAVFVGSVRYRLPVMPCLAVLGGVGLAAALGKVRASASAGESSSRRPAEGVGSRSKEDA